MSETEHHLEEAEHAQHAAHYPFARRVALSMAIVAAALASVTLLSHRSHAEVQVKKTEESDSWAHYQAKKNRGNMYKADAELLRRLNKDAPDSEAGKKAADAEKKWEEVAEKDEKETAQLEEDAKKLKEEGESAHASSNFFDLGELGIELALVLCSVALLAKNRVFWIVGIAVGVLGFCTAMSGFFAEPLLELFRHVGGKAI
ncbi:MAG TPA: DUF4337 domain-containing protein [Gemmataceae bacterium]|nr:DUF4337 domain-containing protein [Gemmataceae bacterium]